MELVKYKGRVAHVLVMFSGATCLALFLKFLASYIQPGITLYIGLVTLPFAFRVQTGVYSRRYLVPALVFTGLAFIIPAKSTAYFMLVFIALCLFESIKGKINLCILFILVLISPLFKFFSDTLGFPLRLWLSSIAAKIMAFTGIQARSAGNIIYIDQFEFYIDQACAGLNMLSTSLLLGIFVICIQQKKENRSLGFFQVSTFLGIVFLLNVFANLFRVLLIVLFKLMPGTIFHELAGIACMAVYVLFPLMCFTGRIVRHFGRIQNRPPLPTDSPGIQVSKLSVLMLIILVVQAAVIFRPATSGGTDHTHQHTITIPGYHKTRLANNVLKFENQEALIYMKPTPFYAPEHNPMICWTGSGYVFKFIRKQTFKGKEIYTGTMEKGKDKLYAAWWFDNGSIKTINQLNWRWNSAFGKQSFYLVNVNTVKQADLQRLTESLL